MSWRFITAPRGMEVAFTVSVLRPAGRLSLPSGSVVNLFHAPVGATFPVVFDSPTATTYSLPAELSWQAYVTSTAYSFAAGTMTSQET